MRVPNTPSQCKIHLQGEDTSLIGTLFIGRIEGLHCTTKTTPISQDLNIVQGMGLAATCWNYCDISLQDQVIFPYKSGLRTGSPCWGHHAGVTMLQTVASSPPRNS